MELLAFWESSNNTPFLGEDSVVGVFETMSESLTLDFMDVDPSTTKMFDKLGTEAYIFEEEAMTFHTHHNGVGYDSFQTNQGLGSMYWPTSISHSILTGSTFVSTMEAYNYPFFGTIFHPERIYIYNGEGNINHSENSHHYNQYFGRKFV